jgi:hypothetical protein
MGRTRGPHRLCVRRGARLLVLAASLALPAAAAAQQAPSLLESYGRLAALLDYMTGYVGEILLSCAARSVISEQQAEARYQAYRARNAALLGRAEQWRQAAEQRLQAQGEARAARQLADESGLTAMAAASIRAQEVIGKAADARATCSERFAAFESGHFDLSRNAELVRLLQGEP